MKYGSELTSWVQGFGPDLRVAARGFQRTPGFTLLAALPLALGIGASAAMFSLVYAALLKPLPYREPDRIVMLWQQNSAEGSKRDLVTPANFSDWRAQNAAFSEMAAFNTGEVKIADSTGYERINAARVTSRFFAALGVKPLIGRTFNSDEEVRKDSPTALISYDLWQRRFQGRPSALGQLLQVDDEGIVAFTIVGIMPEGFSFPESADVWFPSGFFGWQVPIPPPNWSERCCSWLQVIARLKPGVSLTRAHTDMAVIAKRIAMDHPGQSSRSDVAIVPLREQLTGDYRMLLLLLFGAVGCLLLIACVNVAGLLLARSTMRQNEVLIRSVLGATRSRILRQLLAEGLILAAIGTIGGVGLTVLALRTFTFLPGAVSIGAEPHLNVPVLGFATAVMLLVAISSAVAPAVALSGEHLSVGLKNGGRGSTSGASTRRLRIALVIAEFGLALGLMTASGLFLRTFDRLHHVSPGFETQHLSFLTLDLTASPIGNQTKRRVLLAELIRRVGALPGVASASAVSNAPLTGDTYLDQPITVEGRRTGRGGRLDVVNTNAVTPEYFRTMGIPVIAGRTIQESDNESAPMAVVISQTAAKRYWGQDNPVGRKFFFDDGRDNVPFHVVGVVGDILSMGLDRAPRPDVYFSYKQFPLYTATLAVRSRGDLSGMAQAIRREASGLNRAILVTRDQRGDEVLSGSMRDQRFRAMVLTLFSLIAVVLAAVGIHGVVSWSVAQRTNEIGIRMALGASRRNVRNLILSDGVRICIGGILVGVPLALATAYAVRTWIYGVPTFDVITLLGVIVVLCMVAVLACYVPARRAASLDPLVAIRYE